MYHILYFRFVEQALQGEVAADLGLSTRHLRRHERRALAALAKDFGYRYHPVEQPSQASPSTVSRPGASATPYNKSPADTQSQPAATMPAS